MADVEDADDGGVVEAAEGFDFVAELEADVVVVLEGGVEKFEDDVAGVEPPVAGEVDDAASAAADFAFDEVAADKELAFAGGGLRGEGLGGAVEEGFWAGRGEEACGDGGVFGEEAEDFIAEVGIGGAGLVEEGGAVGFGEIEGGFEQGFDALEAFRVHGLGLRSSARSQARAISQSRLTVLGETWRTVAVSSMVRPPK